MTPKKQPPGGQAPIVQRVRIRYAKRGPLRFTSHRDFARALERAILRANVPIAYSQGFSPHPKISYASAAPTGVASEAEYLELGLREIVDPDQMRKALDSSLSPGLDVLEVVEALAAGSLADRITASQWQIEVPGVDLGDAVEAFLAADEVLVERLTKQGRRTFDTRGAVVHLSHTSRPASGETQGCAILDLVVRQVSPTVRPDDILSGLRVVADLELLVPPRATRLAQGTLTEDGKIVDPLEADREASAERSPQG